jgi:hypothetical protein
MSFHTPQARLRRERLDQLVTTAQQKKLTTREEILNLIAHTYPYFTLPTRKDYAHVVLILLESPTA